ncbi:MAG: T9SS type A sorting domain-containing protein, partial [Bacteroidales bacterium]|nr:T9SS type A sorting domain-containing protein [Bacteroidales bacterium]
NFDQLEYQLVLIASPEEGGTAEGAGSYYYGESVPIQATPFVGYIFKNWSGDIEYIDDPQTASTIVTMPDINLTITAEFEKETSIANTEDIQLRVYPNPATDKLRVSFNAIDPTFVSIYNLTGQVMEIKHLKGKGRTDVSFDVNEFNPGIYIVKIRVNNMNLIQKVIIHP